MSDQLKPTSADTWVVAKYFLNEAPYGTGTKIKELVEAMKWQFGDTFTRDAYYGMVISWHERGFLARVKHGHYALTVKGQKSKDGLRHSRKFRAPRPHRSTMFFPKPEDLEVRRPEPKLVKAPTPTSIKIEDAVPVPEKPSKPITIKIEDGIPVPPKFVPVSPARFKSIYPVADLKVGQSFFVPRNPTEKLDYTSKRLSGCTAYFKAKFKDRKFVVRMVKELDGVRVWRTK